MSTRTTDPGLVATMQRLTAPLYRTGENLYLRAQREEMLEARSFLSESQWWSRDRLRQYQNERVDSLTTYAYEHVPYYREVMDEHGVGPTDVRTTDDLTLLPILDRATLQERYEDLLSTEVDRSSLLIRETGGTTGEPVKVAVDDTHYAFARESQNRGFGYGDYRPGEPIVKLTGGSVLGPSDDTLLTKLRTFSAGTVFLPAFELGEDNVDDYVDTIAKHRATHIRGYSSSIYQLARLVADRDYTLNLNGVFPTADILYDYQRELIEEQLGEVFCYYTAMEARAMAYECRAAHDFHISDEHVFLEALNGTERVPPGQPGEFAITTLQNRAMPLIRYRNGDAGVIESGSCPCGRNSRRITTLHGRTTDFLKATDGRLVSGLFVPHVFRKTDTIKRIQVYQPSTDEIRLRVVAADDHREAELSHIVDRITEYLGDVDYRVEYVDSIPTSASGKRRFVVSDVVDDVDSAMVID